ncbi:uncharacterized protein DS421_3g62840 [Arachis hypogaea]|nr:uncharacterized protein DS421_3g62840 [Arachis hypogaea]
MKSKKGNQEQTCVADGTAAGLRCTEGDTGLLIRGRRPCYCATAWLSAGRSCCEWRTKASGACCCCAWRRWRAAGEGVCGAVEDEGRGRGKGCASAMVLSGGGEEGGVSRL